MMHHHEARLCMVELVLSCPIFGPWMIYRGVIVTVPFEPLSGQNKLRALIQVSNKGA